MKLNSLTLIILSLFLITIVSAQPPTQFSTSLQGYDVVVPQYEYAKANTSLTLELHAFNRTGGLPVNNNSVNCYLHLYSPNGQNLFNGKMGYSIDSTPVGEWELFITQNNFTNVGVYSYVALCNSSTVGGFASGLYEVVYGNTVNTSPNMMIYILGITLLMIFLYFIIHTALELPNANPRDEYGEMIGVSYLKYLRLPLLGLAYWVLLAINFIVSGLARNYLWENSIASIFKIFYTIQFKLAVPIMIIIFILLIIEAFRDKNLTQLMKRGLPTK